MTTKQVEYINQTGTEVHIESLGVTVKDGETFTGPEGLNFGDSAIRPVTKAKGKGWVVTNPEEKAEDLS